MTTEESAVSTPKGYPREIFKDSVVDSKLICAQCKLVLKRPTQTPCGHRFCFDCVHHIAKESESELVECLVCRESDDIATSFPITEVFPDNALARIEYPKIKVFCPQPGCQWTDSLKNYESHAGICSKMLVTCDVCHVSFTREQLARHTEQGHPCPFECGKVLGTGETSLDSHIMAHPAVHLEVLFKKTEHLEKAAKDISDRLTSIEKRTDKPIQRDETDCWQRNHDKMDRAVNSSATTSASTTTSSQELAQRLKVIEDAITVLGREMEKLDQNRDSDQRQQKQDTGRLHATDNKVRVLQQLLTSKDATVSQLTAKIQMLEKTSYDGTFVWRINDVSRKRDEAKSGTVASFYSIPFYSARAGYKLCIRAFLNGDGLGRGTHISLFCVIMRGDCDAILTWPFRLRVSMSLVAQTGTVHITDAFRPDPTSSSFQRPTTDMNVASGFPRFMTLDDLERHRDVYIKEDTMFIRVKVGDT